MKRWIKEEKMSLNNGVQDREYDGYESKNREVRLKECDLTSYTAPLWHSSEPSSSPRGYKLPIFSPLQFSEGSDMKSLRIQESHDWELLVQIQTFTSKSR